jgi:hypothetical protein
MKKFWSKRVLSFSLLGVMGASVIGFFTYYIVKLNVSDVPIEEDDTFAEGEAITFDNFDKVYIIEHTTMTATILISRTSKRCS